MASRRDELNAYTFARKRTVGAFLQPSGGGNDEDAPRPLRAVLPSVVVGAVIVAGFGMWGVLKPSAPVGWDDGKNIIQAKDSTTRYVVLPQDAQHPNVKVLHQVLNMSSAKLVLPAGSKVVQVADSVIDAYPNHGATIGIQYAPDRLPQPNDAGAAKKWSVCNRPSNDSAGVNINQALFVAAGKEATMLEKKDLVIGPGQSLFVQERKEAADGTPVLGSMFLVDSTGKKHAIGTVSTTNENRQGMIAALFRGAKPQLVTSDWLNTVQDGDHIDFPDGSIPGFTPGTRTPASVNLSDSKERYVGRLLQFQDRYYVVGSNGLNPITPFQEALLAVDPNLSKVYSDNGGTPKVAQLSPSDYTSLVHGDTTDSKMVPSDSNLPQEAPKGAVNTDKGGGRTVVCSTYEGMDAKNNIKQTIWASTSYPADISSISASAHVTPGAGLFYRAVDSTGSDSSGSNFLITETGLRYPVQANSDGGTGSSASPSPQSGAAGDQSAEAAQARLGYKDIQPTVVPQAWSNLVPVGPVLSTSAAVQAQNA